MKTPISYYGGKQRLAKTILKLIPSHTAYVEPFCGGAAIYFGKEPSEVEVLNDTNKELINFYRVVQNDFYSLEREIRITLHSRTAHRDAQVVYGAPHMFSDFKRAWAVWVLSSQSFAAMLDSTWGYDKKKGTTTRKIKNKREMFGEELAIRLQNTQIECADALRIINSRDTKETFYYIDPPYYNSDCGHYDGYSIDDFEALLKTLSRIEGKFLLSSYPSPLLSQYTKANGWQTHSIEQRVSVANNTSNPAKRKVEVLTANYNITAML